MADDEQASPHLHLSDWAAWRAGRTKDGKPVLVPPGVPKTDAIMKWKGLENCRRNRQRKCAICQNCPFRWMIELAEAEHQRNI